MNKAEIKDWLRTAMTDSKDPLRFFDILEIAVRETREELNSVATAILMGVLEIRDEE